MIEYPKEPLHCYEDPFIAQEKFHMKKQPPINAEASPLGISVFEDPEPYMTKNPIDSLYGFVIEDCYVLQQSGRISQICIWY